MPKIIENLEKRLIEEAGNQITQSGYCALTIRSVAKAVGVGVGTVYNYFPSKEALVAHYLLTDWKQCICRIHTVSDVSASPEPVLRAIHDQLMQFYERHQAIFCDRAAAAGFAGSFSHYHGMLRSQLAAPLSKFCEDGFASEFIAEALLTWTMAGTKYDEIYGMIKKLF